VRGSLLPGEPLIYERVDNVVFARYRDAPHNKIPRWIVGGHPDSVSKAQGDLFTYTEWQHMLKIAQNHPAFKKQLDRTILMYYTIKDAEELKE
tara:strand:+ start:566 stop:844 length:279 start_codon:yes stop_codon:yes gene_type:complete